MNGLRRAAAELALLTAADRQWILARLSAHERHLLEAPLQECGIWVRHDPESVRKALRSDASVSRIPSPTRRNSAEIVASAKHPSAATAMEALPIGCLALVLEQTHPSWLENYLHECGPAKRQQIAASLQQAKRSVSVKFSELLVDCVAEKLAPDIATSHQRASRFELLLNSNPS